MRAMVTGSRCAAGVERMSRKRHAPLSVTDIGMARNRRRRFPRRSAAAAIGALVSRVFAGSGRRKRELCVVVAWPQDQRHRPIPRLIGQDGQVDVTAVEMVRKRHLLAVGPVRYPTAVAPERDFVGRRSILVERLFPCAIQPDSVWAGIRQGITAGCEKKH